MHKLFRMRKEEFRLFLPLLGLYFLLTLGFFLGRTAKDALFFSQAGPKMLPLAFLINSLFIFFAGGWIAGKVEKLSFKTMSIIIFTSSILIALGFAALFHVGIPAKLGLIPYFLFFTFFELPYLNLTIIFWDFAQGFFTERQADGIFPKITSGGHIGTTLAGLIAVLLTTFIGAHGLIYIWAASLLMGLGLFLWIGKNREARYAVPDLDESPETAAEGGILEGFRAILRYKYALLFTAITFGVFFVMSIFDYALATTFINEYGADTDTLTVLIGWITIAFGLIATVIQLTFVPWLIKKLGAAESNLVAPSLLTVGGFVLMSLFKFPAAAFARGLFLVNEFVFNQTLLPFIYQAIPSKDRTAIRSTIEGTVTNVALGAAGLFLVLPALMKDNFQNYWLGMTAFIAGIIMIVLTVSMKREYNILRAEKFDAGDETGFARGLESLAAVDDKDLNIKLREGLMSPRETTVVLTLDIIRRIRREESLSDILTHVNARSQDIRLAAIQTASALIASQETFDLFRQEILTPGKPGWRRFYNEDFPTLDRIADVYFNAQRGGQLGQDFQYLLDREDSTLSVKGLAICYIIRSGSIDHMKHALTVLEESLKSDDADHRIMSAEVMGNLAGAANIELLEQWVDNADSERLSQVALDALAKIGMSERTVSNRVFSLLLSKLEVAALSEIALKSAAGILSVQPGYVLKVEKYWRDRKINRENSSEIHLKDVMIGAIPQLPRLLTKVESNSADSLLIDMFLEAEQQTAQNAMDVLDIRIINGRAGNLTKTDEKIMTALEKSRHRLCHLGIIGTKIKGEDEKSQIIRSTLLDRIENLFTHYCVLLRLTRRTTTNGMKLDRNFRNLRAEDVLTRDNALKALEIELETEREIYLEISDFIDALDFKLDPKIKFKQFAKLAEKYNVMAADRIDDLIISLLSSQKDLWLTWLLRDNIEFESSNRINDIDYDAILPPRDENDTESIKYSFRPIPSEYLDEALLACFRSAAFKDVPLDDVAEMVLNVKSTSVASGTRLLLEQRSGQDFCIIVDGEVTLFKNNEPIETLQAPCIIGHVEAFSNLDSTFGARAHNSTVKVLKIPQSRLPQWISDNPKSADRIIRNMIWVIDTQNEEMKQLTVQQDIMRILEAKLGNFDSMYQKIISNLYPAGDEKISLQKRYVLDVVGVESIKTMENVSKKHLEQYYLVTDKDREVRFRMKGDNLFLITMKGRSQTGRQEITLPVNSDLYYDMKKYKKGEVISKMRYSFTSEYAGWSVDVYNVASSLKGLVIAEIELTDENSELPDMPSWFNIIKEISSRPEYENRNLAFYGLPDDFLIH